MKFKGRPSKWESTKNKPIATSIVTIKMIKFLLFFASFRAKNDITEQITIPILRNNKKLMILNSFRYSGFIIASLIGFEENISTKVIVVVPKIFKNFLSACFTFNVIAEVNTNVSQKLKSIRYLMSREIFGSKE